MENLNVLILNKNSAPLFYSTFGIPTSDTDLFPRSLASFVDIAA
jgi:hypothetical protein